MTINGSELSSLSAKLKSNINTFVTDANSAINSYTAKVNTIWCSPKSKELGGTIKSCLTNTDSKINTRWFSSGNSGINGGIRINVQNFNSVEKTNFSWNTVSFEEPQVGNIQSKINEKFGNGHAGVIEGAKASELDGPFDAITNAYVNLFKNFTSTVSSSDAFSPAQKSALVSGFTSSSSELSKVMEQIKTEIHTVFSKEDTVQAELESTNKSNAEHI